ncbi:MAG: hypothetical protein M0R40_00170 [Firmicutes bacterium]|nr:hypothetical protein [Bacillota bacterium]
MSWKNYNLQQGLDLSKQLGLLKRNYGFEGVGTDKKEPYYNWQKYYKDNIDKNAKNGIINLKVEGKEYNKDGAYDNQKSQRDNLPDWAKPVAKRFLRQYEEAYALSESDPPSRAFYDARMRDLRDAGERLKREVQEIRKMTAEHPENGRKYGSYINAYYNTEGKERDKYDELAFWLSREHAKYLNNTEYLSKSSLLPKTEQSNYTEAKAGLTQSENINKYTAINIANNANKLSYNQVEFGKGSYIAKELDTMGTEWRSTANTDEQERIHKKAELLRGLARTYFDNGNKNNTSAHKKIVKGFKNIMKYKSRIKAVADNIGIDVGLLATVVFRETVSTDWGDIKDFPAAYIGLDEVSVGLCQIQPQTARVAYDNWLTYLRGENTKSQNSGLTYQQMVKNLNDPYENIRYAAIIIWDYINTFGITDTSEIFKKYTGHHITGQNASNYVPYAKAYFNKL